MRITVFGNCQTPVISEFMGLQCPQAQMIPCPRVHLVPRDAPEEVFAAFAAADVIVHQPISDSFGPIGMDALKTRFPDKTYISFPSIFFSGVVPQIVKVDDLDSPGPSWHDIRVMHAYVTEMPQAACVTRLENDDGDYQDSYRMARDAAREKEADVDVPLMDLIEARLQVSPTFYSAAHPENYILWHAAGMILSRLGLPTDADAQMPTEEYLDSRIGIVPGNIPKSMGYAWSRPLPGRKSQPIPLPRFVADAYAIYGRSDRMGEIYAKAYDTMDPVRRSALKLTPGPADVPRARGAGKRFPDRAMLNAVARNFWIAADTAAHPGTDLKTVQDKWLVEAPQYRNIAETALNQLAARGIQFARSVPEE